ncbi:Resolvase, N terminal domain [Clostridium acidisoli DSM 12555]|uniref:Resolvase, N terminal domain n=1 Tax=Clostridium acidisoli DSM 12555 TaxID=1121291 RepID=A0A1W1XTY0_9CLOT|nr:recombinase family protein [Clostridium acidisoli]SMC27347.1 Resolvase, N terminal domain [Clostridium acidisoli DSM 12555]
MINKKIAYIRPLVEKQSLNMQISDFVKFGVSREDVFCDANYDEFNEYEKMKNTINKGDTLYIKSLSVLGKNPEDIIEQLGYIKNVVKADVNVLNMFMMDTSKLSQKIQLEDILKNEIEYDICI